MRKAIIAGIESSLELLSPDNIFASDSTDDIAVPYVGGPHEAEDFTYLNAATCPDCSGGMIRQGGCCFCPECGFESCGI